MIRLIITIALCVLTAIAAVWLTLNPGTANFEFLGWQAQTSFALAMGILLIATFLLVVVWWLVVKIWTAPDSFRKFQLRRRRESGFDALERALIASAAGQGELAVRQAARADALLDRPALSRLLAARAAESAGDLEGAQRHYELMLEDSRTRLVARRGLASIAEARGDHQLAITHASEAFDESRTRWAFDSLFNAQVAEGRWEAARKTLTEAEKRKDIAPDRAARRRAVLLTVEAIECAQAQPDKASELAERAASASPGFAPAAALAARFLAARRRHRRAAELIETAWQANPHPALARVYGDLRKSDTKAKRAERLRALAALNPEHREARLLKAEVALENRNLEAARSALAPLMAERAKTARLCALASRLARLEGDEEAARRLMARAAHAPVEANWSDMDQEGQVFPYAPEDWKRMVFAWGDEARLIHPRYERFEDLAEAVPETALLEAPSARRAPDTPSGPPATPPATPSSTPPAGPASNKSGATDTGAQSDEDKRASRYYEPGRAPDDPGVDEDGQT